MVLTVFALLLAVGATLAKRDAAIRDYHRLRETFAAILSDNPSDVTAADVLKEIERQKSEIAALRSELKGVRQYQEKAKLAEDVFQELRRGGVNRPDTPEGMTDLRNRLQIAKEAVAEAEKAGASPPSAASVAKLLRSARGADQRYKDLLGQNRNLEAQLSAATGGKGGELPPCWASPQTGKAEYIFDVTITSTGLIVSNNASQPEMAHRSEQYQELPISMIQFGTVLSPDVFRRETAPIRQWGDAQDQKCRFYVRLIDHTKPDEKAVFKRLMLTTGDSFYYYLVRQ